jgi:DNA polymerase III subunit delta'|tara:strand:- start:710 stop:1642 length:933 start_codon:yes stop_codon:yes gene_type:complete
MKPSEQTKLFGLNKYFDEIIDLYSNKKMPNKILLSGKKGSGKSTLAYHIINHILSETEDNKYDKKNFIIDTDNRSFKLLNNKTHPNFYLIDLIEEKKNIEINQIREMITCTNKSIFNKKPRFILIDNIENLNKNSTNALLKIIEEPNESNFFILIHNNNKNILPTLKSRCLTFKINLSFSEVINISNLLIKKDILKSINNDLINYYNTPGDFVKLINFSNEKKIDLNDYSIINFLLLLIDNKYYKKNKFIKDLITDYIELYFLKRYKISKAKNKILDTYYNFINKVNNTNKYNLDEESLFMEFKSEVLNG